MANFENGRRPYVTVVELLALAYVLDVAPIHLLVPTVGDPMVDSDPEAGVFISVTPDWALPPSLVRAWVRGERHVGDQDPRIYHAEKPLSEFTYPEVTPEQIEREGQHVDRTRGGRRGER